MLSLLLGIAATLRAVAMFWPGATSTTHAQQGTVLNLDRDCNNVACSGGALAVEEALNDALDVTISVWVWRSFSPAWDSWTQGGPSIANSLDRLGRGEIVGMRTSRSGPWTQIGAAQAPGAAGLNCWDLNGNGVFDRATEDTAVDGVADALDCRGEPGLPGRACWDSNANGVPDPDEDVTGDGTADALDCPATVGEISSVFLTTALTGIVEVTASATGSGFFSVAPACPPNTVLTGGGFEADPSGGFSTIRSRPIGNTWAVTVIANGTTDHFVQAWALCATQSFILGGVP